jgi:hypothetical protein
MSEYFKSKYLKYKFKCLNLKSQIGGIDNGENILIAGGGPVGLITALSLLKKYDKNQLINVNNIFLVERTRYWRPQVFFIQNSYTYDTIDFIRDIDLETYNRLERMGCYVGSPPSMARPYCFAPERSTSLVDRNNDTYKKIRSPLSGEETTKRLMTNLSLRISDFNSIILDRILEIQDEIIDYYINKINDVENAEIRQTIDNNTSRLVKAALIRDHLIKENRIRPNDVRPLIFIYHPDDKYKCIFDYYDYKLCQGKCGFIKSNLKGNLDEIFITNEQLKKSGYMPFGYTDWKPINLNGDIMLQNTNLYNNHMPMVYKEDYNIVFACDGQNSMFLDRSIDKYWSLKNRTDYVLNDNNSVEVEINDFIKVILDEDSVIKLNNDKYIVISKTKKKITSENNRNNADTIEQLTRDFSNSELLLNYRSNTLAQYGNEINYVEFVLRKIVKDGAKEQLNNQKINQLRPYIEIPNLDSDSIYHYTMQRTEYKLQFYTDEENYDRNHNYVNFRTYYTTVLNNLILISNEGNTDITSMRKYNTLSFEEGEFQQGETPIINACVLFYKANRDNNTTNDWTRFKEFEGSTINMSLSHPLITGHEFEEDLNKVNILKDRTKRGTITEQVYINNDQAQYFNNSTYSIDHTLPSKIIHYKNFSPHPQHAFRVFGVNLNTLENIDPYSSSENLQQNIEVSSTNPNYYVGFLVSTEINMFHEKLKSTSRTNENDKKIVTMLYQFLWLLGRLYSQDAINIAENIENLLMEWEQTYGQNNPNITGNFKETPIHKDFSSLFGISLKYKQNAIRNTDNKKIIFVGDSNTTVNFFSGTGVNNGLSNLKYILENFNQNIQVTNNYLENKNRKTIYNSLLSSQNISQLSGERVFKEDDKSYGPYINYYTSKTDNLNLSPLDRNIDTGGESSNNSYKNLYDLLENYDNIFNIIKRKLTIIDNDNLIYLKKIIKHNIWYCIQNAYIYNPILGSTMKEHENGNYLANLHFNYFDFCNNNRTDKNGPYLCDLTNETEPLNIGRTSQKILNFHYTT